MAQRIPIHWDKLLCFVPENVPTLYKVESDGLPSPDTLVMAGTGAEGKSIRTFLAHLLHAAVRRVGELETSLAACEVDKSAMDKALASVPQPVATTAPGDALARIAQLEADLKKANTKATVYYSSWKSLERHVNGKAKQIPSDELRLAEAVTSLVEKGYISDIMPGGQIPVETMCGMVAGVAEKLPPAETLPDTPYLPETRTQVNQIEHIYSVGDPYPVETRVKNPDGKVHIYVRQEGEAKKMVPESQVTNYEELEQINTKLDEQLRAAQRELETLRPLAEDRRNEIFFRTTEGVSYGCDNMAIGPDDLVNSMAIKVRRPDGAETRIGLIPTAKADELIGLIDERSQLTTNWQETAAQHARNEEFYRDLLDQVAGALNDPDVFQSDDGTVQQDPIRLKIPEMVAALNAKSSESMILLAHNISLLDKFRSGVRAITDPMEGQDEKLLEMLHRMKHRALYTGNGTHLQAQSTEMRNGVLYRITGLYYDGHDYEPVDFVNTELADVQPEPNCIPVEEPKAQPTVIDMAFQGLLGRITDVEQPEPLEDCHTISAEPLQLSLGFPDGNVLERRFDGFDFTVLTVPRAITPKQGLANHLMGSEYMVETNTLYLLAAWKGEHPTHWKLDASFDLRPQIINRER